MTSSTRIIVTPVLLALCCFGVFLFLLGAVMHIRRQAAFGRFTAWSRDHLATKCVPRPRNYGVADVAGELAYDESILTTLAKKRDYTRLTDVLLCHLMEHFYDRQADTTYDNIHQLEDFLFDFFVFVENRPGATLYDYIKNKRDKLGGAVPDSVNVLFDLIETPFNPQFDGADPSNNPPPTTKLDHTGSPLPLSKYFDFSRSVQVVKSVPAMAHVMRNLSMDLMGAGQAAIHPEVGLSVRELDSRFNEIAEASDTTFIGE